MKIPFANILFAPPGGPMDRRRARQILLAACTTIREPNSRQLANNAPRNAYCALVATLGRSKASIAMAMIYVERHHAPSIPKRNGRHPSRRPSNPLV